MKKSITVIIPTYNSWQTLRGCLNSIYKQTLKPTEIIVVDNGSTDGTSEKLKKHFHDISLVTLKKNTGVTGGRNMGIKVANKKSKYLFFFDHDMVADKKMLEQLVNVAELDKRIGIVTPKIYYWEDKKRIWSAGTGVNLLTGQVFFRGGEEIGQYEKVEEVQVAPAAILTKREVISKIGCFDDRYFAIFEDTDFCFRAKRAGFKTYYSPKAIAYHKISTNPKDEATRLLSRAYLVGRNRVLFMRDFSKNFLIFLLFLPIYFLYYFSLAVKYGKSPSFLGFIQGTIKGLMGKKIVELK